jgi:hypothetical protein
MTLQETLTARGYRRRDDAIGVTYELGASASLRVACSSVGYVRVYAFDSQMTCIWSADFDTSVPGGPVIAFISEAEKILDLQAPPTASAAHL